jgi:hypothetical protein
MSYVGQHFRPGGFAQQDPHSTPPAVQKETLTYTRPVRPALRLTLALLLAAPVGVVGQRGIPAPDATFGFKPGDDYKLATYDQSIEYFKRMASASRLVQLVRAGTTSQRRPMFFALVSSPENLAKIDRYREIARRLAHPGTLTEAEAHQLAREGKAFVHIDGGLHSTEVAGPQHTPMLLYDLVNRAGEPGVRQILDNVVLMLWPTINPDGQQMVAEWYMQNVGTPYELSGLPRLYQEYVGHDNNRDAYMLNMIESRVLEHTWREWEPQIIYVHHQSGPFPTRIWLPPFSEPVGSEVPSLMAREVNMIGMAIAKGLEERGQRGATHMGTAFDAWYPGYVDYAPNFKNIAAFWTETALFQYATPHEYTIDDFPENMRDLRPRSLYASPWPPGWWRLGDAVSYMETASWSVLEYAAKYKDSLLFNRYKAGRDQIARGAVNPPSAYFIPPQQRDPAAAVELLRRLAFGGLRVSQLTSPVTIAEGAFPQGTWVVPMDQEFAAMAREVLNPQRYPDLRQYPGGPPERPYDAAGWSLPLQMDVQVVAARAPLSAEVRGRMKLIGVVPEPKIVPSAYEADVENDAAPFDSVPGAGFDADRGAAGIVPPAGRINGAGSILVLDPGENNTFKALNAAWQQGATVSAGADPSGGGTRYAVSGLAPGAQELLVTSLALHAERTDSIRARPIHPARIGVFEPWTGSMDAGWTRWVLERYGFSFVVIRPEDFKTRLADKVDVLVLADDARVPVAGAAAAGRGGRGGGAVRTEYAYQLTADDLSRFDQFVRGGGTVVCANNASAFAIQQLKLPVRNTVAGLPPEQFFLRGSIVAVTVDPTHPIMAGMPDRAAVFVSDSPVFEPLEGFAGTVLARYAESGSPLLSGYLIGEQHLQGKAAALDLPLGAGHAVLLGFRPQWRGQSFGTFRVLFNALLYSGHGGRAGQVGRVAQGGAR